MKDENKTKEQLIKELKEMRIALAKAEKSELILNTLMENIPEGVTIADVQNVHISMISRYARKILGGAHGEMTAKEVTERWKVYTKDGSTRVAVEDLPLSRAILKDEIVIDEEVVQINEDGHALPLLCNAAPIHDRFGNVTGGIVAWRDITRIKQAEEKLKKYREHLETLVEESTAQLRESENKYRAIFKSTGNAIAIFEEDTTISLVNSEFENLFHCTREETEGKKSWKEFVPEDDLEWLMENHRQRRIKKEEVPQKYELRLVDGIGVVHNAYMTVAMIPETQKSVASFMDITPLKKAEKALEDSEALYRNLFENAPIGMFQTTFKEGRFLRVNSAYAQMLGYESPEDLMSTVTDVVKLHVNPEDRAALLSTLEKQDWFYGEYPRYRKDGSIMIGKVAIRRILQADDTIAYIEGIVEDITEQRQAEEALRKSEKELRIQAQDLLELNTTLKVLLNTMEKDQEDLKEQLLANLKEQVLPYLDKLKKTPLREVQIGYLQIAEAHLEEIASPFVHKLTSSFLNLTKKEIQIASLVKDGKTSKEIAGIMSSSQRVIEFHRENIRAKLGLKNKKGSLAMLLRSFS